MTQRTIGKHRAQALSRLGPVVVSLALLLEGMSSSSINVQVAEIRTDLGLGDASLALVAAAFLVAFAGALPTAGRLVDARDRRTVFLAGVALFGVGCLLSTVAFDATMLVAGRATQGVGAALSAPAALAIITHGLPEGRERNRAVAIYGAMGAAGFSLGLVLPGFVVHAWGWRASFAVLVPVVVVVLLASWRVPGGTKRRQDIDFAGAALVSGALMLAVHAISGFTTLPAYVIGVEFAAAGVLAWILWRRGGIVGFPRTVVLAPRVLAACIALASIFAGVLAGNYVLSLGLQAAGTHDPFQLGMALLPQPLAFALLASVGSRLVTRHGPARVLAAGAALIALAFVSLAFEGVAGVPPLFGLAQVAIGAGLALSFPAATIMAVIAAPQDFRVTVACVLATWQNVGAAVGLALVTAAGLVPTLVDPAMGRGLMACALLAVVGCGGAWIVGRPQRHAMDVGGVPRRSA